MTMPSTVGISVAETTRTMACRMTYLARCILRGEWSVHGLLQNCAGELLAPIGIRRELIPGGTCWCKHDNCRLAGMPPCGLDSIRHDFIGGRRDDGDGHARGLRLQCLNNRLLVRSDDNSALQFRCHVGNKRVDRAPFKTPPTIHTTDRSVGLKWRRVRRGRWSPSNRRST